MFLFRLMSMNWSYTGNGNSSPQHCETDTQEFRQARPPPQRRRALLGAACPALAMAEEPKPQEAAAADAGALHPLQWPPLGPVRHPRPEASPQQYCHTPPRPPFPAPLPKKPWMGMFMC